MHELIDLARTLEGLARNAGTHAGGVVIAPSVLHPISRRCTAKRAAPTPVTQFDKDDVEAAGLVKFDFLGLRTLTIIDWAVRDINAERGRAGEPPLVITALPMDDKATYALLKSTRTTAVFQLESRGMKDLIRRLQPDRFGDIVALVALFRPGPLQSGMVDDFIERKHDTTGAAIDYLHPNLQPVLAATYGVILYQEQVMQIAQILAGYTLGGADPAAPCHGQEEAGGDGEAARDLRQRFGGARCARGAGHHDLRSHGEVRRLRLQQVALRRVCAAVVSNGVVEGASSGGLHGGRAVLRHGQDRQGGDAHRRMRQHGIDRRAARRERIRACLSASPARRASATAMGAIKGVGASAVEALIEERTANGLYENLPELCRRVDLQRVNRRVFEALIRSGSLDRIGANRATLTSQLDRAVHLGEQNSRAMSVGQVDLFGLSTADDAVVPEWSDAERLSGERETLGSISYRSPDHAL